MTTSWILVANASEARIFSANRVHLLNGDNCALSLVKKYGHPESRQKGASFASDRLGNFKSTGSGTFVEPTDLKEYEAECFAKTLCRELVQARNNHGYEDLIVVAAPHFHGLINNNLARPVNELVSVDVYKDYTKDRDRELVAHLQEFL